MIEPSETPNIFAVTLLTTKGIGASGSLFSNHLSVAFLSFSVKSTPLSEYKRTYLES
jgi:hypothetical protein